MAFRDYEKMLEELALLPFDNEYTDTFIQTCFEQNFPLTEAQLHEIVRLYNIHCIPKRWENALTDPRPKQRRKKK